MNLYITSDLHFYDNRAIQFCRRPYSDVTEMNQSFIDKINALPEKSELWHLGDFFFGDKLDQLEDIISAINPKIFLKLLIGNHDHVLEKHQDIILNKFKNVKEISYYREIRYDKKKIILFHYPIVDWKNMFDGSYHFHGHCHGLNQNHWNAKLQPAKRRLEVTIDQTNYEIKRADELLKKADDQNFLEVPNEH